MERIRTGVTDFASALSIYCPSRISESDGKIMSEHGHSLLFAYHEHRIANSEDLCE